MIGLLRARVPLIVAVGVAALAVGGSVASRGHAADATPAIASSYSGTAHNITYGGTSPMTLTGVTADSQGNVSGQAKFAPPLYGDGPFTGAVRNGNVVLTIASTVPNPCGCTNIVLTGTVAPQGSWSGTYTVNGQSQRGTWEVSPSPAPVPAPISAAKAFTLPSSKVCVSRRKFTIRIRKLPGVTFISAVVKVRGKPVATVKRSRITAPVNLTGLPKGTFTVSIIALASDGRTVTGKRTYHTCAARRPGSVPKL
jgi:hypothetical protein